MDYPATYYGTTVPGSVVEALNVRCGEVCAVTTTEGNGFWRMEIGSDAPCAPQDGDTITFRLNGQQTAKTETWRLGSFPADIANGVTLP